MTLENSTRLYLVRHGESIQNVNQNLDRDSFLSDLGKKQSADAGVTLRAMFGDEQPAAIINTGLRRTIDTAQIIKTTGKFDAPIVEIPEFREREMGIYNQMELSEIVQRNPYMESMYQQYGGSFVYFFNGSPGEGVESLTEMKKRILRGLFIINDHYFDKSVVVVAHAGSIKMIRFLFEKKLGMDLTNYLSSYVPKNCEIHRITEREFKKYEFYYPQMGGW